ncbi:MAG: SusC/RagA family TonB-linked outer membrane protein [Bacteroidales bacterium]|nr:SusC/RagA family TonB-linked outer membrane protein [Bacteroidales bacterium]
MMKAISLKRLASAVCGFLLCVPMMLAQNTITVKGKVIDSEKQPVIGAAVLQNGTTNGAATDIDGNFTLTVPSGADLEVSAIGYETLLVKATSSQLTITLKEESTELDETVVVGYGTTKKASLTSAITNIREEELTATKQSDVTASLQGKVPGLLIHQVSGGAGDFDTDLNIRGFNGEPMVVVDGVVRTAQRRGRGFNYGGYSNSSSAILSQLNPEDIESISVLKDASASIYGMGAGNGVILITTKKGAISKPSVRYSNTLSFGVPSALPNEVSLPEYMRYRNEMLANSRAADGYFSDEEIAKAERGDIGYRGTNWHETVMKKVSFQQNHTVSVSGGNNQTQYYLSTRFNQDKGILNGDKLGYKAFNFQGNLTTKITENLTATYQSSFDFNHRVGISTSNSEMNFWYYVGYSQPNLGPYALDANGNDIIGHYSTANGEHWNPLAILDIDTMGYSQTKMNSYNNSLDLKYDAPFLKGLVLDAFASFNVSQRQTNLLDKAMPIYDYLTNEFLENKGTSKYSESWNKNQQLYGKLQANYNHRWGQHNFTGMAAVETRLGWSSNLNGGREFGEFFTHDTVNSGTTDTQTASGTRNSTAQAGYLARFTYDYQGKYLAEVSARLDGSYLYAPGHRWGFFPAYSLGWRVSEEKFVKENLPWLNNFKVRWSDGQSSLTQGQAYAWQLGYNSSGQYVFDPGIPINGYANNAAAETILSWQHVRLSDIGFDFEIKNGIFGGSVDWFWRNITGIGANSIYSNSVPDFYGISLPSYNLNASQNVGIDLQLTHRHHIGKVNYRVTGTLTFTRNRQTKIVSTQTSIYGSHEAYYKSFMEGRWSNALSGTHYEWEGGQFGNWADINDYNVYTGSNASDLLPGMYKIKDRDGNGVINSNDQYYTYGANADAFGFGNTGNNPPLQFGLMIFINWKNLDFNATFSGAAMDHKFISLSGPYGYGYFYKMFDTYTDRYHLADGYTDPFDPNSQWVSGYWPALTTTSGGYTTWGNGTYRSVQPYNFINATYLRLKSVEIGYNLPRNVISKIGLKGFRVYASGTNLLTFCNKLLKPYDPERNFGWIGGGGGAPIMKTFALGVNINF